MPLDKASFIAGWKTGFYEGGEHDCRMFTPTAEASWERYLSQEEFRQHPLKDRLYAYKCRACEGPVVIREDGLLICQKPCKQARPFEDPVHPEQPETDSVALDDPRFLLTPPTPGQIAMLQQHGIGEPTSRAEAAQILNRIREQQERGGPDGDDGPDQPF